MESLTVSLWKEIEVVMRRVTSHFGFKVVILKMIEACLELILEII